LTVPLGTIDCHAHLGEFRGYDLSEETLLAELDRGNVALALVSNIDGADVPGKTRGLDEGAANRATAHAVHRNRRRLRGLLWARPNTGSASNLASFLEEHLPPLADDPWTRRVFVGIKLHPEMNGFAADDPAVDPYMELAREYRVPVVIHCDGQVDQASAARIHALARRHPQVPVVLYHMGFRGPYEPAIQAAQEAGERGDARLYLETAQAPVEAVLLALRQVGPRRILFGTDATYFGSGHYEHYRALRAALAGHLEEDELERVMRLNACQLFSLTRQEEP
jgi:predicted TIM-barrel fold metal-dependent hydrolase